MNDIILKPILTEKMADLGERLNRYAFEVIAMLIRLKLKMLLRMLTV